MCGQFRLAYQEKVENKVVAKTNDRKDNAKVNEVKATVTGKNRNATSNDKLT